MTSQHLPSARRACLAAGGAVPGRRPGLVRRQRAAGQVRHQRRRLRGRGVPRQGAQDRRELPAVRQGQALRRHDLSPRDRQLHGPGRRLRRQLSRRSPPARRWRTKAARRWPKAARRTSSARWPWRAPTTRNSATAQFFINVKDNDFLDPTLIPPGDPVPEVRVPGPRLRKHAARPAGERTAAVRLHRVRQGRSAAWTSSTRSRPRPPARAAPSPATCPRPPSSSTLPPW